MIHFIRGPGQNRFLSCSSSSLLVLLMAFRAQYVERKQELKVASVPVWIVFSLVDIYSYLSMQCQLYFFLAKARWGTCTTVTSNPPKEVLHRASFLLEKIFGSYHVFKNNCEDFAIYFKRGLLAVEDTAVGRSGQALLAMLLLVLWFFQQLVLWQITVVVHWLDLAHIVMEDISMILEYAVLWQKFQWRRYLKWPRKTD